MVEAPVNGLEAVDTMEVNSVMMSVIHTRSPERSEGEAKHLSRDYEPEQMKC